MRRSEAVRLIMLVNVDGLRTGLVLTDGLWSDLDEAIHTLLPGRVDVIELIQQVYRTAGLLGIDHGEADDWEDMLQQDPPVEEHSCSIDPGFGQSTADCMRGPNAPPNMGMIAALGEVDALLAGIAPTEGDDTQALVREARGTPPASLTIESVDRPGHTMTFEGRFDVKDER